ncbi:hypothetical protein CTI12_AA586030 [Artemisia annua]|uniref:Uncharacterized protein n=1 Tax=Artemisia annua TaxID=35608 RepID=A0A2U1KMK9_ARTAN|nr:hypothetical protein CTI12_AA586030 [Artemisia annua]
MALVNKGRTIFTKILNSSQKYAAYHGAYNNNQSLRDVLKHAVASLQRIADHQTHSHQDVYDDEALPLRHHQVSRCRTTYHDGQMSMKRQRQPSTMQVFRKMDIEIGVKELNTLLECCIEDARKLKNYRDDALEEIQNAYSVFAQFRRREFELGEETYGPFLMFLIDMEMVEEFHYICLNIKRDNPESFSRLAYYEMLLWIKLGDEDKIQQLIANADGSDRSTFNESYLVALCKGDRQEEVLMLLERIDIKKLSSKEDMEAILKLLGRFLLESHAKKFILELKDIGWQHQHLLELICIYAMSIPNIKMIEDIVIKVKNLQAELKVASSSVPLEKLIKSYCDSLKDVSGTSGFGGQSGGKELVRSHIP